MKLRHLCVLAAASLGLAAAGCVAPAPAREPVVTKVVHDSPALRAALIRLGYAAADAGRAAPVVHFADVVPPRGPEIVMAWELPSENGGARAAISVHQLERRGGGLKSLCYDAAGDGFAGGVGGAIQLRDVNGDFRDDLLVRRREGRDEVLTIYASVDKRFGVIGQARGHRIEVRDLDGDRRAEVLISRLVGEGIRGFPEIMCLSESGKLTPAVKRYTGVMPDEAKAYIAHVREASADPAIRAMALRSASAYLERLGHPDEAALLAREAGFVAPAEDPTVARDQE